MNRAGIRALASAGTIAAVISVWAGFGADIAGAQTENEKEGEQCAALHLVLVNGTFDTSAQQDSTVDHGFGAQIAGPAMRGANNGPVADPSAGISVESALEQFTGSSIAVPSTAESVGDLDRLQEQVWNSGPTSTAGSEVWGSTPTATSTRATDAWGSTLTTSDPSNSTTPFATGASEAWTTQTTEPEVNKDSGVKIARTYITYPAAAGGAFIPGLPTSESVAYADSMKTGAMNTAAVLQELAEKCPDTKVFLAGHSQGAQVASLVARAIGTGVGDYDPDKIAGVALFSDPTREVGGSTIINGSKSPAAVPGTEGDNVSRLGVFQSPEPEELSGGGLGADTSGGEGFGSLANRTASWCVPGDLVCDLPISGPLSQLAVNMAQQLNLSDPEASLKAISDTLSPAVVMGGVNDIKDGEIDYGDGGFSARAVDNTRGNTLLGTISSSGVEKATASSESQIASDLGESVIASVNTIGGMALGAGVTVLKKAVTVENLAQVALAGVAGPQAAMGVAAAKLGEAALEVLTPETAVGMADEVFKEVNILGISGEGLAQVAVEAAGHGQAHNAYNSTPSTADGRTAIEATTEWAIAASFDASGEHSSPQHANGQTQVGVKYDSQQATQALAELAAWREKGEK